MNNKMLGIVTVLTIVASAGYTQGIVGDNSIIDASVGASVNYYHGPGNRNFGKYDNDRVNFQVNGMLGLTLATDKQGRKTRIAAFGGLGFNNRETMNNIFADQGYQPILTDQQQSNNFYLLEGGLIIVDKFRISTGVGQQNFQQQALLGPDGQLRGNTSSLQYNSTTVGFIFNLNPFALNLNCNIASGKDFEKTVITPSAGLMFKF